jgi:Spy/CpxP family protein refolding chaperone
MRTLRTTLAALLLAAPVLAAPGGAGRHGGFGRDFGPGPDHSRGARHDRMAELLELDATQRAAFDRLRADGFDSAKPKFEQMRALHDEVRALLDAGSTDAAAIGAKVLAAHQLRNELRAERGAAEAEFVKLLSDEQRFAFEALREARDAFGERRRGHGSRHGFGPRRGGAPGELD